MFIVLNRFTDVGWWLCCFAGCGGIGVSGCGSLLVSRCSRFSHVLKQLSYVRTPSLSLLKWLPKTKDTKIVSSF